MPTFKHPCPRCGQFIARDVAACPFCGTSDPFVPMRCAACRTPIEDPAWVACPKCGASLRSGGGVAAAPAAPRAAENTGAGAALGAAENPGAVPASAAPVRESRPVAGACAGCGSALPDGARFCLACGTLAS